MTRNFFQFADTGDANEVVPLADKSCTLRYLSVHHRAYLSYTCAKTWESDLFVEHTNLLAGILMCLMEHTALYAREYLRF